MAESPTETMEPLQPKPAPKPAEPSAPKPAEPTKKGLPPMSTTAAQTQPTQAPLPPQSSAHNHSYWGFVWILLGGLCLYFCLLSNAIQIQTTTSWFAQDHGSLILSFNLFDYKTILPSQHMSQRLMLACLYAWFQQLIQTALAVGMDLHLLMGKKRSNIYLWASAFYVVMNSLADLNFGGMYSDWWQPWLLAGACFMVSFFFCLGALNLIIKGFRMVMN